MALIETTIEKYKSFSNESIIILNPSTTSFAILENSKEVSLNEIKEEYLNIKWRISWDELLQSVDAKKLNPRGKENNQYIRMLIANKGTALNVKTDFIRKAFNVKTLVELFKKIHNYSLEDQRNIVNEQKPSNINQAADIFLVRKGVDFTGLNTVIPLIDKCQNVHELLCELINIITNHTNLLIEKGGVIKDTRLRNYLELMALLHRKKVFLYPFICKNSETPISRLLLHKNNVNYYFDERFADVEACKFVDLIKETGVSSSLAKLISDARCLTLATSFRACNQLSDDLLDRIVEINEKVSKNETIRQERAKSSRYNVFTNTLISIYNAEQVDLKLKIRHRLKGKKHRISNDEFCDFSYITSSNPELSWWSSSLKEYCLSSKDTQFASRVSTCKSFANWLLRIKNPPRTALEVIRTIHINDYSEGFTLRNYYKNTLSIGSANKNLTMMRQFFDFAHDLILRDFREDPSRIGRYSNPIDPKFDSFKTERFIGTKRVPIEAKIMDIMRNVLIGNDYEFPKKAFTFCYAPLTNHKLNIYQPNVFCPSIANLLYFMLWIPVRKIQAQLLDSGEGDKYIFDFKTRSMIKNLHPFSAKENRSEGVIQLVPSGILGIDDIVGLYITTNKSSKDGYHIPWVSDELLESLKNQLEWLSQYSPLPELRGKESLGKMIGEDAEKNGKKFYSLFRDPTAEKLDDPYAPASAHRISYAWGVLCKEVERRINIELKSEDKIKLTTNKSGRYPTSRFDIHTLRVSGITDLLDKGVPLGIVQKFVAGHATFMMTLWYDNPPYFKVREHLENARKKLTSNKSFSLQEHHLPDMKKHFVVNELYLSDNYSPYDVLEKNAGIISVKLSGICPGTSCEEGGYDQYRDRFAPVPVGDRGPSCPQCRFWITGPMFLLGQVIEGNQLIRKIKVKIKAIDKIRESILDAEDNQNTHLLMTLNGREDREMRILSNMITEWYERMKFYEASISKLDEWIKYEETSGNAKSQISLLTKSTQEEIKYNFQELSEIELTHFISTTAEFFPEFIDSDDTSVPDLEQAISRFTSMNNVGNLYFKLSESQKLVATNMITGYLIDSIGANNTSKLIEGQVSLSNYPELSNQIKNMLKASQDKSFMLDGTKFNIDKMDEVTHDN